MGKNKGNAGEERDKLPAGDESNDQLHIAINDAAIRAWFAEHLLGWYRRNRRALPWRESRDPYRIWVSEIMLQQTRVDTVIPYYERFMAKFPTAAALAEAAEEEVLKAWEGLGYYSRARNLQAAVREVQRRYGGEVPADKEAVSALQGVGPYTSGAILSIAFNQPEPAVDGNVMRVLARFFHLADDVAKPSTRGRMERLARALIPDGAARDFNQALMELGAMVCTPRQPKCASCPVSASCRGLADGVAEQLPVKARAKPPRLERRVAALVADDSGPDTRYLLRRRPGEGLLAGMWELPHYLLPDFAASETAAAAVRGAAGLGDGGAIGWGLPLDLLEEHLQGRLAEEHLVALAPRGEPPMQMQHIFSHIRWDMLIYRYQAAGSGRHPSDGLDRPAGAERPMYRWATADEVARLTLPNLFIRIFDRIRRP